MNDLKSLLLPHVLMAILIALQNPVWAQPNDRSETARQLKQFERDWTDNGWAEGTGRRRQGYLRKLDDTGWQARMLAFRSLVLGGANSMPVLEKLLESDSADRRILAAQALSFLRPQALQKTLIELLHSDENSVVRLYAADALGTLRLDERLDWTAIQKTEKNVDVRKHAGYADERNGAPVATDVIETLRNWDPKTMSAARLGKVAPDFKLNSANGETISLSQYRGKKSVVLVFIYGDT